MAPAAAAALLGPPSCALAVALLAAAILASLALASAGGRPARRREAEEDGGAKRRPAGAQPAARAAGRPRARLPRPRRHFVAGLRSAPDDDDAQPACPYELDDSSWLDPGPEVFELPDERWVSVVAAQGSASR
ncbi:unnamed protein product [Prorocentrum cordatum]|uniref:Uncharacterized protein n=1 Tax=Prorocentrum cordatum TaxID=2364126 RepID=A0ABN9WRR4_9DINO|nr:unnamed protein product [Polarella glacialis]